jgi:P27 family predicted phage terminase small subunit
MGRNPKPLHLIQGHLTKKEKEKRAVKEQTLNSSLKRDDLNPPEWLDEEGKKLFRYIVDQYEASEMLTNLDVLALATYCDLHSRRLQLLKEVREKGTTLKNKNSRGGVTYIQNPALTALNSTIKLLQTYEARFGFTIFDRTKIALKDEKPEEKDELEQYFGI